MFLTTQSIKNPPMRYNPYRGDAYHTYTHPNQPKIANTKEIAMAKFSKEEVQARENANHQMGLIAQAHGFKPEATPAQAIKALRKAASKESNEYAQDILKICEASVHSPETGVTGAVLFDEDGNFCMDHGGHEFVSPCPEENVNSTLEKIKRSVPEDVRIKHQVG